MTKSRIIAALAAIAIPGILLTSCDEVKENERYIDMGEITAQRTVLLEEFTGQRCTNCPVAHRTIENIIEQYGDNVVAVSIHAGRQSLGENEVASMIGLRVDGGNEYASHWNITEYPSGVVNRTSGVKGHAEWSAIIRQEMEKPSVVDIDVKATYDDATKKISINTGLNPGANIEGYLQLWIAESGIVAPQQGNASEVGFTYKPDYVHNHVFRAAVNGTWGEAVTLITREPSSVAHEIAVNDNWNVANLSVIAFIYNSEEGVLQATSCKVTSPAISE